MLEQIKLLVRLQQMDTERLALESEAAEGPVRIANLEQGLVGLTGQIAAAAGELGQLRRQRKEIEETVEANQTKMKRSQSRLPMIKNNREYRAVLKEIDDLKRMNYDLEDEVIEVMERLEALEAEQAERHRRLGEIKVELEENKQVILDRVDECRTLLREMAGERQEVRAAVDVETMARYDQIAYARGGLALAPIKGGTCQACFMNLTPQQYQILQHMERLMTCPSCHRLIYWGEHEAFAPPDEPGAESAQAGEGAP
ncbi:MAG: hypothetical protein KJ621_14665 [Proteobacteria bacterium]|nr:hypothetical protein [Pseudomonadota bacterium]